MSDDSRVPDPVRPVRALSGYFFLTFLVFSGGAFAVAGVAWLLDEYTTSGTELVLPILLVYGVVTLLVALAALVGILSHFNLSEQGSALGLPEGSVQAVIALVLVLIFAITAVFLLTIEIGPDGVSERLATQILTTAGTLAVAVAGFYFGTRAVETGTKAAESAVRESAAAVAGGQPSIRVVTPTSPAPLEQGKPVPIVVSTTPRDAPVAFTVSPEDAGEVVQLGPEDFEYRPAPGVTDEVTVRFELARDPTVSAELKVVPPATDTA